MPSADLIYPPSAQFHALRLLLILEFGSFAVFEDVNFFFIPLILAQKESRLDPPSGCGGFKLCPSFFAEARPLAFRPPFGFLPSLRVHAGLAIEHRSCNVCWNTTVNTIGCQDTFARHDDINRNAVCDVNFHQNGWVHSCVSSL